WMNPLHKAIVSRICGELIRPSLITMKLFYLALRNISNKWTLQIRDWKAALNRFTIQFEGRLPQR
ncbi:hypothetical protein, partial [Xanthomonas phaseoli]